MTGAAPQSSPFTMAIVAGIHGYRAPWFIMRDFEVTPLAPVSLLDRLLVLHPDALRDYRFYGDLRVAREAGIS